MTTYSYVSENGTRVDRKYPMGRAPKRINVDGTWYKLDYGKLGGGLAPSGKDRPQHSLSNGVLPSQIPEAQAMDRRVGAPQIQYDRRGRAIFANRFDKNRWLRAHKRIDWDSGYSDPAPGTFRGQVPVVDDA